MAVLDQTTLAGLEVDARAIDRLPEARLISRLRAGDLAAFEELVAHFERPVYALCFRLLGDAEEARDAAQETFLKVYRGLSSFRGEAGLKTWIYRIALNQAMNQKRWWRRRHRDEAGIGTDMLRYGRLEIDVGAREARLDGDACTLTSYQFSMLLALAKHAGRVLSRDAIMDLMKNERLEAFDRSIDVHISRIRAAIEDDPKKPRRIITVRGSGYVFAKAQD
jgi:RNA polymerase sigma factor (sigma-70 family)